jgi:dihydrofolate reductase
MADPRQSTFSEKGPDRQYTVSIIPILLGEGIPLFKESNQELPLKLVEATTFDSGLVQLSYEPVNL